MPIVRGPLEERQDRLPQPDEDLESLLRRPSPDGPETVDRPEDEGGAGPGVWLLPEDAVVRELDEHVGVAGVEFEVAVERQLHRDQGTARRWRKTR